MTMSAADNHAHQFEIEAAPENITIHVHGKRFLVDCINDMPSAINNDVIIYTSLPNMVVPTGYDAYLVSDELIITAHIDCSVVLTMLPSQFAILINRDKTILTQKPGFKVGEYIKLRYGGEIISYKQLVMLTSAQPSIWFDKHYRVEIVERILFSGSINHYNSSHGFKLFINNQQVDISNDGQFEVEMSLVEFTNVVTACLYVEDRLIDEEHVTIYRLKQLKQHNQHFLWIEQGHNIVQLSNVDDITFLVKQAVQANITAFILDVKGIEGFSSYKQNDLSSRPYVNQMKASTRQGIDNSHDFLASFITISHAHTIQVYAAFNVFAEGSYLREDIALPDLLNQLGQFKLTKNGTIEKHQCSEAVKTKNDKIAYVNPTDPLAQALQLQTIEEVLRHYDVDGILLDRCRFDDEYADFSDLSKQRFTQYCVERNIEIKHFPDDIYRIEHNSVVEGPLIIEWWKFRSHIILDMVKQVRLLVNQYKQSKQKHIALATYVGSWYEYAYLYGINWASPSFKKQYLFNWEFHSLYDHSYIQTGYTHLLDFIVVGLYQQTLTEIEQYLMLSHYVTNQELPIISGIALPYTEDEAFRIDVFQLALSKSSGVMLFDHCHIKDWQVLIRQLQQAQSDCNSNHDENNGG